MSNHRQHDATNKTQKKQRLNKIMKVSEIVNKIESEPLHIEGYHYMMQREYLNEMLANELEHGDVVGFACQYLAASRRAVLHALQEIDAPDDIIERIFTNQT